MLIFVLSVRNILLHNLIDVLLFLWCKQYPALYVIEFMLALSLENSFWHIYTYFHNNVNHLTDLKGSHPVSHPLLEAKYPIMLGTWH